MKQRSLVSTGFELSAKKTRKQVFLEEMNQVVPWGELVALIQPHAPPGKNGRAPFATEVLLRIHFLQQWFGLSDLGAEEALHDVPLYRAFAKLDAGITRLPDESTILRFRHLLEEHHLAERILSTVNAALTRSGLLLKTGTVVDATIMAAPSSTKNRSGERDPEMHQTKKGNNYHFGMKAHIGVDAQSGLVHSVIGTAANVNDVTQASALLHGEEQIALGDAGYQGIEKRPEHQNRSVTWHTALRPGKRKALPKTAWGQMQETLERIKASIRAKVEHPFHILKNLFKHRRLRYRGLFKNTAHLFLLFGLSNLWMVRRMLLPVPTLRG